MKEKTVTWFCVCISLICASIAILSAYAFADEETPHGIIFEAPIVLIDNRVFTSVELNDKGRHLFLIDNGCRYSMVDPQVVKDGSFQAERAVRINALNRRNKEVQLGNVRKLSIGDLALSSSKVIVAPVVCRKLRKATRRNVRGILGYESLRRFVVTFDFQEQRILLQPSRSAASDVSYCPHTDSMQLEPGKALDGVRNAQMLAVEIYINGTPVSAVIDFGFTGALLTTMDHRQLRVQINGGCRKTAVQVLGREFLAQISSAKCLEIGKQRIGRVKVIYVRDPSLPEFTLIGMQLLKRFKLTFDFTGRRLVLCPRDDQCGMLVASRR